MPNHSILGNDKGHKLSSLLKQMTNEHKELFKNCEGDREVRGYYVLTVGKDPNIDESKEEMHVLPLCYDKKKSDTEEKKEDENKNKKMFRRIVGSCLALIKEKIIKGHIYFDADDFIQGIKKKKT
jgi:hypothetical protein